MKKYPSILKLTVCYVALVGTSFAQDGKVPEEVSFRSVIAPILRDNCLACHGAKKAEGGYRVDTYEELLKAGDSGVTPIATAKDQTSELLRRVECQDATERMPAENDPLDPKDIDAIKRWIAGGAKFDGQSPQQSLLLTIPPAQFPDPPATYPLTIPITATTFSPDGKLLVTSGYHEVLVWNSDNGQLVRRLKNLGERIFALAFTQDAQTLVVGCGEPGRSGEVRLVNFNTGELKGVVARAGDVVLDLAVRPASDELAVALADSTIRIIKIDSLADVRTIASHADWVTAVCWSDDGKYLASASRDKSTKVYDGTTGELISSYLGHGAAVRGVSLLADGKQVVSVGADHKLHRWEIEAAKKVAEVATGGEAYRVIRSGTDLFVPCSDKRLLRIDLTKNAVSQEYKGHNDWVLAASYQPAIENSPRWLASGSFDGEIRLWNSADTSLVRNWVAKP